MNNTRIIEPRRPQGPPEDITLAYLQVVIMPNGEILSFGKSIGFVGDKPPGQPRTMASGLYLEKGRYE
jgi:hypothetical protein